MNCPYCNQPMKPGTIRCHNGFLPLTWRSDDGEDKRIVEKWSQAFLVNLMTDLHYCKACDVMIRKFSDSKRTQDS